MKASLKIKLGSKVLEISGEGKDTEIIKNLSFWSSLPDKCTCGNAEISLMYKNPKGNDYYGLKCGKCGAELTFHQFKTGGFYLTQDDTWKKWQGNNTPANGYQNDFPEMPAENDNTDLTF